MILQPKELDNLPLYIGDNLFFLAGYTIEQLGDKYDAEFIIYSNACERELRKVVDFKQGGSTIIPKNGKNHIFLCEDDREKGEAAQYIVTQIERT